MLIHVPKIYFLNRWIYDEIESIEYEEDYQKEEKHESIKSNDSII